VTTHAAIVAHYAGGAWYPEGGGQAMADRLAAAIEAAGGAILLRTRATRILVEGGRVTGVELDSHHLGRRVVRAPVVISNADLKHTMRDLVGAPHLAPAVLARVADYEMSPGLGVVYLGVRRDLAASGLRNANYVVFSDYDLESAYATARAGRFVERPPCYLSLTSLKDPDNPRLAPPGVANVQLMTVVPAAPAAWGADADDVASGRYRRSEGYQAAKHAFAERMLDQAETVLPGLRGQIVHREVATPLTHTRFTGSSDGTSYGIALTPAQSLWRRPTAGTDIGGLYLCGASTITGHGIAGTMISGVLAAARVAGWRLVPEVLGARA
jgi:phytoene dehydrogenase-like protein